MRVFAAAFALVLSVIAAVQPADARRTAIDRSDPNNPQSLTIGGYCDFNGEDCDTPNFYLPYYVDFGGVDGFVNGLQIKGNGVLNFVSEQPAPDNLRTQAGFISRIRNATSTDQGRSDVVYDQSAQLSLTDDGDLLAQWYSCFTPQSCFNLNYSMLFHRVAGGFDVTYNYFTSFGDDPRYSGYYILTGQDGFPNVSFPSQTNRTFFVAAQFRDDSTDPGAVPEPATWSMLIVGFGIVGAAMRRRTRQAALAAG